MPSTAEKDESDRMSFHSAASQSPMEGMSPGNKFKDSDERGVFEVQLTQLQEQLVATMIDNQSLREWLAVECLFVLVSGNEWMESLKSAWAAGGGVFVCACVREWANGESEISCQGKLQTLVYDILPPTTAIVDYTVGLKKLSTDSFLKSCWLTDSFSLMLKWQ